MISASPAPEIVRLTRQRLLEILSDRLPEMVRMFGVVSLSLFGSAARDELRDDSDVDVLVEYTTAATYTRYMGLKFYLEDLLGRQVDLVTTKALRQELRLAIEQEAISVA
jgi:predicted nucleotidyltransferase